MIKQSQILLLIITFVFGYNNVQAGKNEPKCCSYNICTLHTTYDTNLNIKYRMSVTINQIKSENPYILCIQKTPKIKTKLLKSELNEIAYQSVLSPINENYLATTFTTALKNDKHILHENKC